ncbi:hypothetical protein LP420_06075 [Massilia sp. B-10]|nr:hypothetical protein LP420_06075 [Massilia sp. B-10]
MRGAEVILKAPDQGKDMCLIEGEGHYGFVACKYLSVKPVPRAWLKTASPPTSAG